MSQETPGTIDIRELRRDEWSTAMAVATRAFLHEPFIAAMFGANLHQRFVATREFYAATPWTPIDLRLGAFLAGDLVGVVVASPEGGCHLCKPEGDPDADLPPDESRWQELARLSHVPQPPHARIGRLVVEPTLHGAGIGRALLVAALRWLEQRGATVVLLECETGREDFYLATGFDRVAIISTPTNGDEGSYLMRRDTGPENATPPTSALQPE